MKLEVYPLSTYGIWAPVLRVTFFPRDIMYGVQSMKLGIKNGQNRAAGASNKPTCLRRGTMEQCAIPRCPPLGAVSTEQSSALMATLSCSWRVHRGVKLRACTVELCILMKIHSRFIMFPHSQRGIFII